MCQTTSTMWASVQKFSGGGHPNGGAAGEQLQSGFQPGGEEPRPLQVRKAGGHKVAEHHAVFAAVQQEQDQVFQQEREVEAPDFHKLIWLNLLFQEKPERPAPALFAQKLGEKLGCAIDTVTCLEKNLEP